MALFSRNNEHDLDYSINDVHLENTSAVLDHDTGLVYELRERTAENHRIKKERRRLLMMWGGAGFVLVMVSFIWGKSLQHSNFFVVNDPGGQSLEQITDNIQDSYIGIADLMEKSQEGLGNDGGYLLGDFDIEKLKKDIEEFESNDGVTTNKDSINSDNDLKPAALGITQEDLEKALKITN